ncbi:MAG: TolC family protein [Deltaproteobacteria bacterium]|nr:TolC family protein [Deltaproteobacteria bacterium]
MGEPEYVQAVLALGLELRVAEREVSLARADEAGAGLWPNPSIEWERQAGPGGHEDRVFASVPLVISGRLGLEQTVAERGSRAAEARRDQARAEVHAEAARRFTAVIAEKARVQALEASLGALVELAKVVQARARAGSAAGYETLRIEVERASVEGLLRGALASKESASLAALQMLGPSTRVLPDFRGALPRESAALSLGSLLEGLESRRADLRALALEAERADAELERADRGWVPEPTVRAGILLLDAGAGLETAYVAGLAVPLRLFERSQGEAARASAMRSLLEAKRTQLLHSARSRVSAAAEALSSRREQLDLHRTEVVLRTEELRAIAKAAYEGGSADLLVLVDAERAAREAQLIGIDLARGLVDAETELLFLAGVLDGSAGSTHP